MYARSRAVKLKILFLFRALSLKPAIVNDYQVSKFSMLGLYGVELRHMYNP